MKLSNFRILAIHYVLQQPEITKGSFSRRLAFAFAKLLRATGSVAGAFQDIHTPSPAQEAYDRKREQILAALCERDENGRPKTRPAANGNGTEFALRPEKIEEARTQLGQLESEMPEAVAECKKRSQEIEDLSQEETEIDVSPIPLSLFPDTISATVVNALYDVIVDDVSPPPPCA
jgi:hypothetical protein